MAGKVNQVQVSPEVEVIKTIKRGVQELSKKLIEEASQYSEFRADMIKTAIALMQSKYRIQNIQELVGIKRESIDSILSYIIALRALRL